MQLFPIGMALFLLTSTGTAANSDRSVLITDDVQRFLTVIEAGQFDDTLEDRLQTSYFDPGTPGLAEYARRFGLTAESLAEAIRRYPDYYHSLRDIKSHIAGQAPYIHEALARLRVLYPATDLGPGTDRGGEAGAMSPCASKSMPVTRRRAARPRATPASRP